jgi:hypothetical protein
VSDSRGPCAGCAYTTGADANREPRNYVAAQLCALGGLPFYCHHAKDGSLVDIREIPVEQRRAEIQAGRLQICRGWRRETAELHRAGYFDAARDLKRQFAEAALRALGVFTGSKAGARKERAAKLLRDVLLALWRSRGFHLER